MYWATGADGIPAELFKIIKHGAVKVLHSICQLIWKTQQQPQEMGVPDTLPVSWETFMQVKKQEL